MELHNTEYQYCQALHEVLMLCPVTTQQWTFNILRQSLKTKYVDLRLTKAERPRSSYAEIGSLINAFQNKVIKSFLA